MQTLWGVTEKGEIKVTLGLIHISLKRSVG